MSVSVRAGHRSRAFSKVYVLRFVVTTAVAAFAIVIVGTPLWMIVVNSVQSQHEAGLLNFFPTGSLHFGNYVEVIQNGHFFSGLLNTTIIAIPSVGLVLLFGAMASWTIARSRSRWGPLAYYCLLGGIFAAPSVVTLIFVLEHLHLYGTYAGLIFVYTGFFMSLAIFLFTGFCRVIPEELEQAARLDGANWITVFTRIVLPLMRPIILTAGVLLLVSVWNDFQFQFFLLSGNGTGTQTLTTGLYDFTASAAGTAASAAGGFSLPWNLVFADVVLTSLPLTVIFAFAQRRLTRNLLAGALNG